MKAVTTFLVLSLAFGATSVARAEDESPAPDQPTARASVDRREVMTRLELGYRGSFVTNPGYNPFSTNDYLPQLSIAASQTVLWDRHFSFAPGLAWDFANGGATARGDATSLTIHRLTIPLEGRAHFGRWGYVFLRAAPGVANVRAEVDDPSAPQPLTKSRWLIAADVSAGYAWLVLPPGRAFDRVARIWVQSDVGYGWVATEHLNLTPGNAGSGTDLGSLALNGVFFRIAAAASF